jgi:hypothetical protein
MIIHIMQFLNYINMKFVVLIIMIQIMAEKMKMVKITMMKS